MKCFVLISCAIWGVTGPWLPVGLVVLFLDHMCPSTIAREKAGSNELLIFLSLFYLKRIFFKTKSERRNNLKPKEEQYFELNTS